MDDINEKSKRCEVFALFVCGYFFRLGHAMRLVLAYLFQGQACSVLGRKNPLMQFGLKNETLIVELSRLGSSAL